MPNGNVPDKLKAKRAARRTQATKIINEATAALQEQRATTETVTVFLQKLTTCSKELHALDREVEDNLPPEAFETEYDSVLQYEERITEAIARLRLTFEQLQPTTPTQTPAVTTTISPTTPTADHSTGIRLQRLQLRKFRGDCTEWQPFWDQFKANVHDNRNLTKSDKFHYLRSLLLGTAAAAISGLQTTEAAYDDAIALLTQRFGDRGRLEKQYLEKLRTLPHVKSSTDTAGLRELHDYVQTNICGLRSLGVQTVTYSSMMTQILLAAIPSDIVLEYHRQNLRSTQSDAATTVGHEVSALSEQESAASSASAELNKVLAFLKAEVESRERSGLFDRQDQKHNGHRKTGTKGHAKAPSAFALHSRTSDPTNCLFCTAKSHATENCNADMSIEDKKKTLAKYRRCFRCTKMSHNARECHYRGRCSKCRGRHADTMCDPSWTATRTEGLQAKNDTTETAESSVLMSSASRVSSTVLLQTFRAWIVSGTRCQYIRGIFDSGSSRTFIREDLARELGLEEVAQVVIGINTFASDSESRPVKRSVVEVTVRSQYSHEDVKLAAIVMPVICRDIQESPADNKHVLALRGRCCFS